MMALPMASAGRFSPFGPRGMSLSPDNSFRFFEDFYAVPSAASESNDGCLLCFVPKNGGRIFDVHKNRLLAHIGAFDPVHLRLLLCARHTTGARRTRPSRANKFKLRHYLISTCECPSKTASVRGHLRPLETSRRALGKM